MASHRAEFSDFGSQAKRKTIFFNPYAIFTHNSVRFLCSVYVFSVWLSKNAFVTSSPILITEDVNPVVVIGSNWTIECFGDRAVTWNYTHVDPVGLEKLINTIRNIGYNHLLVKVITVLVNKN